MSSRDTAGDHGKVGTVQALRELMLVFKAGMLLQENGGCQDTFFFVEQFSSVVPLVIK